MELTYLNYSTTSSTTTITARPQKILPTLVIPFLVSLLLRMYIYLPAPEIEGAIISL